jgi:hypothetical protein
MHKHDRKWLFGQGLYWLFYRSAEDRLTPDEKNLEMTALPCLHFENEFVSLAYQAGIDPQVLCDVACKAAGARNPMNIPSVVDACIAPVRILGEPDFAIAVDQADQHLRAALGHLKQYNDELDSKIVPLFSHLDLIADYTKHIHACRRHALSIYFQRFGEDRWTFSDVEQIAQYPHDEPVEIPEISLNGPVFKEYLELGFGIEHIAYVRLLTEICFHHIQQLRKSPELRHALIVAWAVARICQAKVPFRVARLPIDDILGSLRDHVERALADGNERRLDKCIRSIERLLPVAPDKVQNCLTGVYELLAIHDATQDSMKVEEKLEKAALQPAGLEPGDFRLTARPGKTRRYETGAHGRIAIDLARARASNPGIAMQYALDVLDYVAREAVRENAPPARRAELTDAIRDIADELAWSDLAVHRERAIRIEEFLATNPFNPQ